MKSFKFYSDNGHAWLAVKRKDLIDLGLESNITPYSYQRGNTVYLEEDCDAPKFIEAFNARYGQDSFKHSEIDHGNRSWVRSLQGYAGHKPLDNA